MYTKVTTNEKYAYNFISYSAKLWRWKSLTKFDESSISETLTSKTLTN